MSLMACAAFRGRRRARRGRSPSHSRSRRSSSATAALCSTSRMVMPSSSRIARSRADQILRPPPARARATTRRPAAARGCTSAPRRSPSICRSPPERSPPIAAAQLGEAREELIDALLAPALGRRRAEARTAPRFSATVRLGNTLLALGHQRDAERARSRAAAGSRCAGP